MPSKRGHIDRLRQSREIVCGDGADFSEMEIAPERASYP